MTNGTLPFTTGGKSVVFYKGYLFVDGKVTMVDDIYPDMVDWLKVKAYITILDGKSTMYDSLPKKGQDKETKQFIKILNDKVQKMG